MRAYYVSIFIFMKFYNQPKFEMKNVFSLNNLDESTTKKLMYNIIDKKKPLSVLQGIRVPL